ncbi:hypothetical protein F4804DRAFT_331505 [Jackrogersella minutella]|nr:hypothetical protein F4804DRAFT_331505 [Jackrogersella minutella]
MTSGFQNPAHAPSVTSGQPPSGGCMSAEAGMCSLIILYVEIAYCRRRSRRRCPAVFPGRVVVIKDGIVGFALALMFGIPRWENAKNAFTGYPNQADRYFLRRSIMQLPNASSAPLVIT